MWKGWLPRDEELSDGSHTTLTFVVAGFFAADFIVLGLEGLISRTFDVRDFWHGSIFGYRIRTELPILHGTPALVASLIEIMGAGIFLALGMANRRRTTHKDAWYACAIALVVWYGIATVVMASSGHH